MSWQAALVLLLVSGCGGPETQVEGTWADVETVLSSMERQEQVSREVVTELEAVDVRRLVLALSDGHPTLAQAAARLLPRWIDPHRASPWRATAGSLRPCR